MDDKKDIKFSLDVLTQFDDSLSIVGWANSKDPDDEVYFEVTDSHNNVIKIKAVKLARGDVSMVRYGEILEAMFGFKITFDYSPNETYYLRLFNKNNECTIKITNSYIHRTNVVKKIASLPRTLLGRYSAYDNELPYSKWCLKVNPTPVELSFQKNHLFPENAPKFSIVIPLYKTPKKYLKELMNSLSAQTYSNFEVCMADGSPEDSKLDKAITDYAAGDTRFKYHFIGSNQGISANTNEAIKMAEGDFLVLCDHDDTLSPDALYEFATAIVNHPDCDAIYSDEDKMNDAGNKYFDPHFKPDYNIDLLSSVNYICHLFAVRRTFIAKYGNFDSAFDGAQDYDFIYRMTEHARLTVHVPKVLYHWRMHQNSTSYNPESKTYAFEAGARAIKAHYQRVWPEIKIKDVVNGKKLGIYHTIFEIDDQPLVSIIIPNMDHSSDLDKVVRSVITKGTWKNLEIIIVENNSKEEKTFEYYKKIEQEFSQVHVVYYKGTFNYSKINNFGVTFAHGNYFLFMNNDVELIEPNSIGEMMGYAQRPDVGIVGCRLLYNDNTIQHAGVVIGIGGIADHVFRGFFTDSDTYFDRAMTAQDYSAVTAAVMLATRAAYDEVAGFDEHFEVALNDVDFCLKVRMINKLVVYTPYASFHHYESKSRGSDDTYAKQIRWVSEIQRFLVKWKDFLVAGDPMYNPNLTLRKSDFSRRNLAREKIGSTFYTPQLMEKILTKSPKDLAKYNDAHQI